MAGHANARRRFRRSAEACGRCSGSVRPTKGEGTFRSRTALRGGEPAAILLMP